MSSSFVWLDYETFGADPRRDRPAQFAALRTDADLNPVGEPALVYCRPHDDYLPAPEACLLTGITPQHCLANGVPEHAFAARVESILAEPGTIGVGYNSIRFDDEVTRFLFWRNLIDPYAREWRNGCGRWDLLDVLRLARVLRPDGIEWPTRPTESGRRVTSFKLTDLTAANQIEHVGAHDALADVRATLALARRLRHAQPRLFDFALGLRDKNRVLGEMGLPAPVGGGLPFIHVSGRLGAERGNLALMWPLGQHPVNRNEIIAWDLATDPAELADLDAQAIRARLFVAAADLPPGHDRLPIKTVHVNQSPMVARYAPGHRAALEAWGIDLATCEANWQRAKGLPDLSAIWADVFARERSSEALDPEQDLYGGFVGDEDRRRLQRLRQLPPAELAQATRDGRAGFDDGRLGELVWRYRARNFPETLDPSERARWEAWRSQRLHHGEGGLRSLETYMAELDRLAEGADDAGQDVLGALYDWAEAIAPERTDA